MSDGNHSSGEERKADHAATPPSAPNARLVEQVGKKEQRKVKARREEGRSIWYGLGMFGLVGWSIAIPTLIGIAVGIWIDRTWHPKFSWTLMCLFVGVVAGCLIAWFWVKQESLPTDGSGNSPDDTDESPGRRQR